MYQLFFYKLVLVHRKNCNKTTFVFNMLYVRWLSACVERASSTKLSHAQDLHNKLRCRRAEFTSVQSVTSALQTKRIVIGLLAVLLYCSGTGRPSRGNGF